MMKIRQWFCKHIWKDLDADKEYLRTEISNKFVFRIVYGELKNLNIYTRYYALTKVCIVCDKKQVVEYTEKERKYE